MLADLRARPPAFVLNLCDEGYNNDAFQELHVPAYLEVLGVPYTGAGPACLGLCYDKARSEEHTSELQSLMRISYAVFCLKKKNTKNKESITTHRIRHQEH